MSRLDVHAATTALRSQLKGLTEQLFSFFGSSSSRADAGQPAPERQKQFTTDLFVKNQPHISKPRAIAVLLCYNDSDVLSCTIDHLLENNHDVIAWDHGSSDETSAVLDSYKGALKERDFVPREFDFYTLYPAMSEHLIKNYVSHYDWVSWPDQDELLEGPDRTKSYYEHLTDIVNSPYSSVRFNNFNFWFTTDDDESVVSPVERVRRYCLFPDCSPRRRAWIAAVTNERVFNHNELPGEECPQMFNLRHYPMRTREQAMRRLTNDRADLRRGGANWHYENMLSRMDRITIAPSSLHFDDGVSDLNHQVVFDWRQIYGSAANVFPDAAPSQHANP